VHVGHRKVSKGSHHLGLHAFMALLLTFWIQKAFAAPFGDLALE
jgi:hypothetical protein